MADVKWIKVYTDTFDSSRKIKQIERMPQGDTIVIIWFKLLLMAGKINDGGAIYVTRTIPYDIDGLADELRRPPNIVEKALSIFETFDMIERANGFIYISSWEEHQNIDGLDKIREQNRLRKQKQREKQLASVEVSQRSHVTVTGQVTGSHATDKDKERDKKEDINNSVAQKRTRFSPPSLDDVKAYCKERNNNVDAERFIDYYNSNGWMVGKNKMKDWKAAVRTWENNGYGNQRKQQPKETKQRSYDIDAFERMMYAEENPPKTVADDPNLRKRAESLLQRLVED